MNDEGIVTVAEALAAARPAYEALLERAEAIEDEWSYVNDLAAAWLDRLDEVEGVRGADPVGPEVKTRDSILLTYFVDAGPWRFVRNRGRRLANFVLNEARNLKR